MKLDQVIDQLKKNKYRITTQRLAFLETMVANQSTLMTVEEITMLCRKKYSDINTTTIYRNIEMLQALDLVYALNVDRHTVAYKLLCNDHHHHHIICSNCGEMAPIDYCPVTPELQEMLTKKGYELKSHNLDLYGICSECHDIQKH